MECSLAKPQADQKSSGAANSHKSTLLPTYPAHVGYGMVGGAYGAVGGGFGGAGFAQVRLWHILERVNINFTERLLVYILGFLAEFVLFYFSGFLC